MYTGQQKHISARSHSTQEDLWKCRTWVMEFQSNNQFCAIVLGATDNAFEVR